MKDGFFRVAAASPLVAVADPATNSQRIIELARQACDAGADVVVFPEMCVTGYTCGDLFHNKTLLDGARDAVRTITDATRAMPGLLVIVGAPFKDNYVLFNSAYAICNGMIEAIVNKTYVPNYNEFYERRWWQPSEDTPGATIIRHKEVDIAIEICEDLWVPVPPSCISAMMGASVIFNLSASPDLIGKYAYLTSLVRQQSARCMAGYVYASAGFGESSTDLVFDAKLLIAENGTLLGANERWYTGPQLLVRDIDVEAIARDRMHMGTFYDCAANYAEKRNMYQTSAVSVEAEYNNLLRTIDPHPFVPASDERLKERCEEIFNIQVAGLCKRLHATGCKCLVVGISGGLDSTLALLVAVRAFDRLGLDRKGIAGVTMPGFGTTGRTHGNAVALMEALGVDIREISIVKAVNQHFADIGHDPAVQDVTYENSQARERTQILMDLANELGGMVLGTGDLSELALGWATYNGDQMSMYGVNAGVPKTLVKHLTAYVAADTDDEAVRRPLLDIIDTPISPELLPAAADGTIKQKTEDAVGPYELHDFFLYYTLRYGFTPERILKLARRAFTEDQYDTATIEKWLKTFFRRFFSQQFKRSCMPDGPKVGSVCLSPRGDWRMPSDASSVLFR